MPVQPLFTLSPCKTVTLQSKLHKSNWQPARGTGAAQASFASRCTSSRLSWPAPRRPGRWWVGWGQSSSCWSWAHPRAGHPTTSPAPFPCWSAFEFMTITPVLESLFIIIKTIISGDTSYQGTFLKDWNGDALGIIPRNAANNTTRQMHIKSPIDSTNKCLLMDPTTSTTQKNLTFILLKKKTPCEWLTWTCSPGTRLQVDSSLCTSQQRSSLMTTTSDPIRSL